MMGLMAADRAHGVPMQFQIDGKTYKCGRTRMCDLSALQERLRDARIDALIRNRAKVPAPDVFAKTLAAIIATDPTEKELFEAMTSRAGMVFLAWRGFQRYHPELTEDDVAAWMESNADTLIAALAESELITAEGGERDPAADPTQAAELPTGAETPRCFAGNTASASEKSAS